MPHIVHDHRVVLCFFASGKKSRVPAAPAALAPLGGAQKTILKNHMLDLGASPARKVECCNASPTTTAVLGNQENTLVQRSALVRDLRVVLCFLQPAPPGGALAHAGLRLRMAHDRPVGVARLGP